MTGTWLPSGMATIGVESHRSRNFTESSCLWPTIVPSMPPTREQGRNTMSGAVPPNRTNTLAIVSFVSSFFVSVAGIVIGHMALKQIKNSHEGGRGLAIAGLVIGYVSAAATVVGAIVLAVALMSLNALATAPSGPTAEEASTTDAYDLLDQPDATSPEPRVEAPSPELSGNRDWVGTISVNGNVLDVTLHGQKAPQGVAVFVSLADQGFYDGTSCHRLTTGGFDVLQCGDPSGTGSGGPDYRFGPIENAPADNIYRRGDIALARVADEPNSMGSQFFIMYGDTEIPSDSVGGYTVVGHITSGLEAVDKIAAGGVIGGGTDGKPALPASIESISAK